MASSPRRFDTSTAVSSRTASSSGAHVAVPDYHRGLLGVPPVGGSETQLPMAPITNALSRQSCCGGVVVACRPAVPNFAVQPIEDNMVHNAKEFAQLHRIGVARYAFRCQEKLVNVGPGSYDTPRGDALVAPSAPRWTLAAHSPRLGHVKKSQEEQANDDSKSLRENTRAFQKYFVPEILAKKQLRQQQRDHRSGSPSSAGLTSNLLDVDAASLASPRWMRPTTSATKRRQTIEEEFAVRTAIATPTPMRYSSSSPAAAAAAAAVAAAADEVVAPPNAAAPPRPPPPPSRRGGAEAAGGGGPQVGLRRFAAATEEDRLESLQRTLARPSSATTRCKPTTASSPHWVNGCLRDTSLGGVAVVNPRDGKTDAVYDVQRASEAVRELSPRVSMGTSPRFPGQKPCAPPHRLVRPHSARVSAENRLGG